MKAHRNNLKGWHRPVASPCKPILVTTLVLGTALTAFAQRTPQETLSRFAAAASKRDFKTLSSLVLGGRSDISGFEMLKSADYQDLKVRIKVNSLSTAKNKATAQITSVVTALKKASTVGESVELALQANGSWKIVPPTGRKDQTVVGFLSYLAVNPKPSSKPKSKPTATSLSTQLFANMKDLGLGVLLYLADHDDTFPKTQSSVWSSITPYVLKSSAFKDPKTKKDLPLFLNPSLLGTNHVKVVDIVGTPMLAWGKPGELWFDDSGYTYVAFTDGHVKKLTKAEASKLRWKM